MTARCARCGAEAELGPAVHACSCGGPLDLPELPLAGEPDVRYTGLWRYAPWLPAVPRLSLGEPVTPLVHLSATVHVKLEGALPTGSFKDRGAAVMVAGVAAARGRGGVVDSSGNAGAAIAAYCARAGLDCEVLAPAHASPGKLVQIAAYGARLSMVEGPREASTDAALARAAEPGGPAYMSHMWHPLFLAGTETFAFELAEQLDGKMPDWVALPSAAGTLFIGAARGFRRLHTAGRIDRRPRLLCVQTEAATPVATAWARGDAEPALVETRKGPAEGLLTARPPRGFQVLAEIRDSNGAAVAVPDDALWAAHAAATCRGVYCEPTSATALAAVEVARAQGLLGARETVVCALTGNGLKATDAIGARLAAAGP